ncbi:disease resistance protein RGA2-like [Vitis riparia]|uniref:disease resistance protein RGA2-like n=1 Tax=Vitis riparia TaxID=96939 RepID=UPI00155A07E9|nr:disease resistance protein RGA2-like [Vitis riparia]
MADQIPFSIAEKILTKLGSLAVQEIELACGARKELKKLGDTLTTINTVLLVAEERQEREHAVENWVRRFKDVIYDADDLLDDFATYELRRGGMAGQVSRFFSSSNQAAFHFRMGHRIKDIRGRLDDIANDISKFNFIPRATTSMRVGNTGRETHSFVLMSEIKGRDEDKEKIIEILLQSNNEENLSVVAIVGIGGLGKTTLAQLVYNDEKLLRVAKLEILQLPSCCPSLSELEITDCDQLTIVQLLSSPHLSKLVIGDCGSLKSLQLPSCPSLSELEIRDCDQLTTVQLLSSPHLSQLVIESCQSLKSLQLPSCCPSLSELKITDCDQLTTVQLLSSPHLSKLVIRYCISLESLQLPSCCPSLSELEITDCDQLTTVQLLSSPHLSKLVIRYCISLKSLQLPSCPSLSKLEIIKCDQLTTVQLLSSPHLSKLVIGDCGSLKSLQLPSCPSLSELEIRDCDQLTTVQLLSSPHRSQLVIDSCESLESLQLPSLPCVEGLWLEGVREEIQWQIILVSSSLKYLKISHIYGLTSLFQGIQHLGALEELRIYYCIHLNLSDKEDDDGGLQFQGLRSLRKLFIAGIPKLVSLPKGLQHVTTLETLSIAGCHDFTTLPDWISSLTSLSELKILWCPRFKLEDRSKIAHIPRIDIF